MLGDADAAPFIAVALHRLKVAPERWPEFHRPIMNVATMASFLPPTAGERGSPTEIMGALEKIEAGLRSVDEGVSFLHFAQRATPQAVSQRAEVLDQAERLSLGAIIDAVLRHLSGHSVTDDQIADAMPSYDGLGFANSWAGTFGRAAGKVATFRAALASQDLRLPTRGTDERFVRAVGELAIIYRDATGRAARAYARGSDSTNPDWRPPFAQFIIDLWPIIGFGQTPPSNDRIKAALRDARIIPPLGGVK